MPIKFEADAKVFRALGDPTRQRILQLLLAEELNVTELVDILHQPQSTISRHLKVLTDASCIASRRDGATTHYRAVTQSRDNIAGVLLDWYASHPMDAPLRTRLDRVLKHRAEGNGGFFERLGKRWDELRSSAFGDLFAVEALVALLPHEWTVADIGTGTGYLLPALADNFNRVIAIDPAEVMLDCARQRAADHGAKNVSFERGDLGQLPIKTASVDLAVAQLVLHHVEKPADALAEIHRVLRPGGRVLLVEQEAHENQRFYEMMQDRWWGFDPSELARLLGESGFAAIRHHALRKQVKSRQADEAPPLFVMTADKPLTNNGDKK
ncbi:MAG TPA: metalloregulator ArsR/SmtB family transcription factor [Phycisphaerae bacterium]|nr:metalloregulator ArsR/SmtB family transcription factor [Phycisphaerae bacterium]